MKITVVVEELDKSGVLQRYQVIDEGGHKNNLKIALNEIAQQIIQKIDTHNSKIH